MSSLNLSDISVSSRVPGCTMERLFLPPPIFKARGSLSWELWCSCPTFIPPSRAIPGFAKNEGAPKYNQVYSLGPLLAKHRPVMAIWSPACGPSIKEIIPTEKSGQALSRFNYPNELLFAIPLMQSSSKPRLSSYLFNRFNSGLHLGNDLKR